MKKLFLMVAAAAMALAGCKDEPKATPDSISLSKPTTTIAAKGGESEEVTVTSSKEWTISPDVKTKGVTPSVKKGKSGDKITFTADPNITAEDITVNFNFRCGVKQQAFAVTVSKMVKKFDLVTPADGKATVAADKKDYTIVLDSEYAKDKIKKAASDKEWVTVGETTEVEGKMHIALTFTENGETAARTAKITIEAEDGAFKSAQTVELTQEGKAAPIEKKFAFVTAADATKAAAKEEGHVDVLIDSDYAVVEIPVATSPTWLTGTVAATKNADGKWVVTVNWAANASETGRTEDLIINAKDTPEGEVKATLKVTVTQAAGAVRNYTIVVAPVEVKDIPAAGEKYTLTVTKNDVAEYDVVIPEAATWIKKADKTGDKWGIHC